MLGWIGLVAHQGGWDEALVALSPIALLAGLVYLATVAARRRAEGTGSDQASTARGERPQP